MDDERLERDAVKIIFSAPAAGAEEVVPAAPQGPEILFVCPFCNEAYQVSAELAGKKINCRNCREPCRVDALKAPPHGFDARSFWQGFALGVFLTLLAAILMAIAFGAIYHAP